jgi:hypothetical protein
MAITHLFTRKQIKDYAIVDYRKFKAQTEVRMLALAAAAMVKWVDHAKATFSASTSARYIEALYWEPDNPESIAYGIKPGTFAALLEYGWGPRDLRSVFLKQGVRTSKEGHTYRRIPVGKTSKPAKTKPFLASVDGIRAMVNKMAPGVAKFAIEGQMSQFNKSNVSVRSTQQRGLFLPTGKQEYRTISSNKNMEHREKLGKPSDSWKHPGIRKALLENQVAEWVALNRESFTGDMFQGDPGISA